MKDLRKYVTDAPLVSLVVVNMLPLLGVLFLGWEVFAILLLYWAENVVLGFYNILRMALAPVKDPAQNVGKLFMIPFFAVHYGGFTAGHGMFVFAMFGKDDSFGSMHTTWPCFLAFLQLLFNTIGGALEKAPGAKLMFAALFVSHGVSFVQNYIIKGERHRVNLQMLMAQPYKRIVILHVTIIFGGMLTMALKSPVPVLILLIALKTVVDVKLHKSEHKKLGGKARQQCFVVEQSECLGDGSISIGDLMVHLQSAAVAHADTLDFGRTMLDRIEAYWVLSNFYLEVKALPKCGDDVAVKTWPSGSSKAVATREFVGTLTPLATDSFDVGEQWLFKASSEWMILSRSHGRAKNLHKLGLQGLSCGPRVIEGELERLRPQDGAEMTDRIVVPHSAIDENNHVNNTEYVRWALNFLGQARAEPVAVRSMQITYLAEAFEGEELMLGVSAAGEGVTLIRCLKSVDKTPVFAMRLTTGSARKSE